jgi:large subunit ribosomal protein L24e
MAVAKAKQRAHRQKVLDKVKGSVKLHEPMAAEETPKVREKIKVPAKSRSALVQGDGRSMGMEVD